MVGTRWIWVGVWVDFLPLCAYLKSVSRLRRKTLNYKSSHTWIRYDELEAELVFVGRCSDEDLKSGNEKANQSYVEMIRRWLYYRPNILVETNGYLCMSRYAAIRIVVNPAIRISAPKSQWLAVVLQPRLQSCAGWVLITPILRLMIGACALSTGSIIPYHYYSILIEPRPPSALIRRILLFFMDRFSRLCVLIAIMLIPRPV